MATKKDLTGGIANLLSGADQRITQQRQAAPETTEQPEGTATQEAAPQMKVEPTTIQDESDLINSVEDEELREELRERLRQKRLVGRGRPRKNDQLGRRMDGYDRTSLIINKAKWAKIKEIAFIETLTMKEIVELALDMVIERYESKHGEIIPAPERKKDITEIF